MSGRASQFSTIPPRHIMVRGPQSGVTRIQRAPSLLFLSSRFVSHVAHFIPMPHTPILHTMKLSDTERGATAVEYALLMAFIAGVIIAVLILLGDKVVLLYQSVDWP